MGAIKRNGVLYGGGASNATGVEYDNTSSGMSSNNVQDAIDELKKKHIATQFSVSLTGWSQTTSAQSGTTLYVKTLNINHYYLDDDEVPDVAIGASGVLPTVAEQESYNLLQYVTCDDSVPCLYLYASAIPTTAFYISVTGVD